VFTNGARTWQNLPLPARVHTQRFASTVHLGLSALFDCPGIPGLTLSGIHRQSQAYSYDVAKQFDVTESGDPTISSQYQNLQATRGRPK
jgi:hypothetical protein